MSTHRPPAAQIAASSFSQLTARLRMLKTLAGSGVSAPRRAGRPVAGLPAIGFCLLGILAAAIFARDVPSSDAATLGRSWTLDQTVEKAGLIFEGTVVAIAFRDSAPLPASQTVLPHIFVTYEVGQVLRGRPEASRLTLRFLGGSSGETGRIMRVPHAPLFKLGDRDILFVAGNGTAACPLVACGLGRFRVWQDRVYTDTGLALRLDAQGKLRMGPDRLSPEQIAMEFPPAPQAHLDALRRQIEDDKTLSEDQRETLSRRIRDLSQPRIISLGRIVSDKPATPPSTPPVTSDAFKAFVAQISDRHPYQLVPTASVSPDRPFTFPEQKLTTAKPPTRFPEPRTLTREQQLLRQNLGNPVLRTPQ